MLGRTGSNRTLSAVKIQNGATILEDSLVISYKIKHTATKWSNNYISWYLPKEPENLCPYKNLYVEVHSSLFIIAKIWKQPRCPSAGKCINKLWHIYTMEYYSALKGNERLGQEKT
jgi:hypothetical protein